MISRCLILCSCVLLFAASLNAQTRRLAWDMPGNTVTDANTFLWQYQLDGGAPIAITTPVTCSGTTVTTCSTPMIAAAPGTHALVLWAVSPQNVDGPKSSPFPFSVPGGPTNVRVL